MMSTQFYITNKSPSSVLTPQLAQTTIQRKPSTKKKTPMNSSSSMLTFDENALVFNILGKGRQTLSTAVVQFLIPSEEFRKWKLQEVGVLCFVRDSTMRSYFLEILSLRMGRVVLSQEIYDEFGYRKPRNKFLTFEGDNFTIGLNFASEEEILSFQTVLDDKMAAKRERIAARQSRVFELQNPASPQKTIVETPIASSPSHNRRTTSFDNRLDFGMPSHSIPSSHSTVQPAKELPTGFRKNHRGRKRKTSKPKKKVLDKNDIGLPTDFRVVLHAGFDPERGYVVDNYMDEKFRKLFHMAGVTDKELEDENTRDFILDFIQKYKKDDTTDATSKPNRSSTSLTLTPPPPPPIVTQNPSTARVRPPPVPSRQTETKQNPRKESGKLSHLPIRQPNLPNPNLQNGFSVQPIRVEKMISMDPIIVSRLPGDVKVAPPPPPPPLMTSNTGPPPPPPPPMPSPIRLKPSNQSDATLEVKKLQPVEDERSALMRQIQEGKKLKNVDAETDGKWKPGGPADFLDQIKGGVDLKKVTGTVKPAPSPDSMDGLAGALARALADRKGAINPDTSGSESEDVGEDVFDDDEWE